MEQDRKPRHKPTPFMVTLYLIKEARIYNVERQPLQQVVLSKLDSYMEKNEIRTVPNTIHKNKLKMD